MPATGSAHPICVAAGLICAPADLLCTGADLLCTEADLLCIGADLLCIGADLLCIARGVHPSVQCKPFAGNRSALLQVVCCTFSGVFVTSRGKGDRAGHRGGTALPKATGACLEFVRPLPVFPRALGSEKQGVFWCGSGPLGCIGYRCLNRMVLCKLCTSGRPVTPNSFVIRH